MEEGLVYKVTDLHSTKFTCCLLTLGGSLLQVAHPFCFYQRGVLGP